jgi:hypothetical protein
MSYRCVFACIAICFAASMLVGCEKSDEVTKAAKEAADKAAQKAADVKATLADEAQKYLDQVNQFIKDKKLNEAGAVLNKLDALKDKLPAEWAAKIDSAKQMLDKAKAALGGTPAPTTPALPAPAQ